MRSDETEAVFRRDREAVKTMTDRGWTKEQQDRSRRSMEARHAEYDAVVALMIAQVKAVDPAKQPAVRWRLRRLGGPGCLSGFLEFGDTVEALAELGVSGANQVFHHDREHIAATYLCAKVKESLDA